MVKEKKSSECECECGEDCKCGCGSSKWSSGKGMCDAVYGMGFVGAVIYFIQQADSFWVGVLGVLKALVWPAILIYRLLESFNL